MQIERKIIVFKIYHICTKISKYPCKRLISKYVTSFWCASFSFSAFSNSFSNLKRINSQNITNMIRNDGTVFLSTTKQVTSELHLKTNTLVFKGTVSTQSFYMRFSFSPFTQTILMLLLSCSLTETNKIVFFLFFFVECAKNFFCGSSYHWMCRYHFYPQIITGVTRELDSKFHCHIFLHLHPLQLYHHDNINALFKPCSMLGR